MSRTILFYGDSNTYGYDPANWQTLRYPERSRWTYLIAEKLGPSWKVAAEGMNGRTLPDLYYDRGRLSRMLAGLKGGDVFAVMLGTNDLLQTIYPHAGEPLERMKEFLSFLKDETEDLEILVIGPPHIGREDLKDPLFGQYYEESLKMNRGFRDLAEQFGVKFADAGSWQIGLTGDHVHFSEAGHRLFAEKLYDFLAAEFSV